LSFQQQYLEKIKLEVFFFFGVNSTKFSIFGKKIINFLISQNCGGKKKKKLLIDKSILEERNITGAGLPMTYRIFSI
jgi:hypothetical protein